MAQIASKHDAASDKSEYSSNLDPDMKPESRIFDVPEDLSADAEDLEKPPTENGGEVDASVEVDPDAIGPCPEGTLRGWLSVLGALTGFCATFGLISAAGLLVAYMETHQLRGWAGSDVGWIAGLTIFLALFIPGITGQYFDAHGPRWLLLVGSVMQVGGLAAASFVADEGSSSVFAGLLLTLGFCCGIGSGMITVAVNGTMCQWFDRRRGLACGISNLGSSGGGILVTLILRQCLGKYGWAMVLRIVAGFVATLLVISNLVVRPRLKHQSGDPFSFKSYIMPYLQSPAFCWSVCGFAILQFVVMGISGTLPLWVIQDGFDPEISFWAVAFLNGGTCLGEVTIGPVSEWLGRYNTAMLIQVYLAVVLMGMRLTVGVVVWRLYVFSILWGFGSGCYFIVVSVVLGQLCNVEKVGRYYGTAYMTFGLAALVAMPSGVQMLQACGTTWQTIVFGILIGVSTPCIAIARWVHHGRTWKWNRV